jgi:hypothetical protein
MKPLNNQVRKIVYRIIIPISLVIVFIVYPALSSDSKTGMTWVFRFGLCIWNLGWFWMVPDPYRVRFRRWWKPGLVNWKEQSINLFFYIWVFGGGLLYMLVMGMAMAVFLPFSIPLNLIIAFTYGILYIIGMLPGKKEFKETYFENLD